MTDAQPILDELRSYASPEHAAGMARVGIRGANVLGGPNLPTVRRIAKRIGRNPDLAFALWASGVHEARLLATLVADPTTFTPRDAETWAVDLDSWDICDQLCGNLLVRTTFAVALAVRWSRREEGYVKRAAFALMAELAVHDRAATDERFAAFLPIVVRESPDRRNAVRKAMSWALRQIGKRNGQLNAAAIRAAEEIRSTQPRAAWWVASDALRELRSEAVQRRLDAGARRV